MTKLAGRAAAAKRSFLWVPAGASVSDLIACYLADQERYGNPRPRTCAIVRALGCSRDSVERFDARELTYAPGWRPILRDLLPLRIPTHCKILATHIDRRCGSSYVPTRLDYAADLSWTLDSVHRALRRLVAEGLILSTKVERHGAAYRQRWALTDAANRPSRMPQTAHRGCRKPPIADAANRPSYEVRTSSTHPEAPEPAWRAPAMDGWADLRRAEVLSQLEAGAHVGSIVAVLTVAGVFDRDRHARAIFAGELVARGITTEQLVAGVLAAYDPLPSEGRVRSPGGLLRVWLERGEIPRDPVPVGQPLRDAAEQRRRAAAAAGDAQRRTAESVRRLRAELRRLTIVDRRLRAAAADHLVNALEAALARTGQREPLGELYWLVYDRRGSLAELLELASRYLSEPVLEALPPDMARLALAEANARRQTGDP